MTTDPALPTNERAAKPGDVAPAPTGAAPLGWAEPRAPQRASLARRAAKLAATVAAFAVAVLAALLIWSYYVTSPWTRDGQVRVQVANVAPQVSGQITELRVVDGQYVRKGDVLYVIDPFDFRVRLVSAKASVKQQAADYQVKKVQAERLLKLNDLATNAQAQQQAAGNADMAEGALQFAQQQQDQAEINLQRTQVTSPVNGFVTNLQMRVGDFATTGTANVSVIDADSFWIDGYFEETKLGRVCIGDRAEAQLMGFGSPIVGTVEAVTRGISVSNAASSTQGLPNVNAVYTWVRLAQRVPVRVRITEVPPGIPLVSGLTATVTLRGSAAEPSREGVLANLRDVFVRPAPRPNCIPAAAGATGSGASLPDPKPAPALSPEQVNPGLANGPTAKPGQP